MIISEKQIMQLINYVRWIASNENAPGWVRVGSVDLLAEILNQQSEELKVIE